MAQVNKVEIPLDLQENLISVMRSKHASAETVALAAEAIAADARFSIRFGSIKESATHSDDEMLRLLEASERLLVDCRTSVETFHNSGDREHLHAGLVTLRKALDSLALVHSPR